MTTDTAALRREAQADYWDAAFDVIGASRLDTDLIGGTNAPEDVIGGVCLATDLMGGASLDLDLIGGAYVESDVISGIEPQPPSTRAATTHATHEVAGGRVAVDPMRAGHEDHKDAEAEASSMT